MVNYIPKRGDIVTVDLNQGSLGHEQAGIRPAIVISSVIFNQFTNMLILCPITNNVKGFPTHYKLESSKKVKGAVLCEHIRSIDYNKRNVKFIDKVSKQELENIIDLVKSFFENE